ncbi:TIGR04222 domain-containing membrane protein [Actinoallomurus sp. NPDC052274]|uniref:TIGR04222 domain-containing membrane protein n=1 Tax=Actinoallomurus sp. NPDC052274 TaxID=3155420 RepID=UPI0034194119
MTDHAQLGVYELAYLCGGPARVVTVAVLALIDDQQITVARALHRVRVIRRAPRDKVESAVLGAIPDAGRPLGVLTAVAADSDAVAEIGNALREQRVLPRSPWQLGRISHAHRLRRRLRANPMDGVDRVAVLGPAAIPDAALRKVFQTPDLRFTLPDLKLPGLPDRNDRPYDPDADARTAARLYRFGPGGSGWGL